jgi:D-lactate dehydrogenase (cytochrome)
MIVKEDRDEILAYLEDSSNLSGGNCDRVYIPETEGEVIEVVQECIAGNVPLTVSGGGTGTVGGRIPKTGAAVSMERMNRIKDVREDRIICEAGLVVNDLLLAVDKIGKFYPPFPTERNAFIGGNVSTNASGEYSFRFGPTRSYVQRIRMVTGRAEILEITRGVSYADSSGRVKIGSMDVHIPSYITPPIKCSAGYFARKGMDAIDLVIGSEGTLGIVTEVEVRLIDKLPERFILVVFLPGEQRMIEFLHDARKQFQNRMFTLEFFDESSLLFLKNDYPSIPEKTCAFYIESEYDESVLEQWLTFCEGFHAKDIMVGSDPINYQRLIDFRHKLPENINSFFKKLGITKISLDIAVPGDRFTELVKYYRSFSTKENIQTVLFGHIGENHLHFNLFPRDEKEKTRAREIYLSCVEKGLNLGGTVSAEHGIGKIKYPYLRMMFGERGIKEMIRVKKTFDPYCLIGRDNLFPGELLDASS